MVVYGILTPVLPWFGGWWHYGQLSVLPRSDRAAVMRAVQRGEPVPDPRLAPSVLDRAQVVVASAQRDQRRRWVLLGGVLAIAALGLAFAVGATITGPAGRAVPGWVLTAIMPGVIWYSLRRLERTRAKAEAAADFAAGQIGRSSAD